MTSAAPRLMAVQAGTRAPTRPDRRLGCILAAQGKLEGEDILRVLEAQQVDGKRFGEVALQLRLITVEDLVHAITAQYDLPHLLPDNQRISLELVTAFEPFHACAEQIRALRTQLMMRWPASDDQQARMLAIVSPSRGDGRSYLAANLAVAFAQLGQRTLLVDADLRWPRQHRIFDVSDRAGLSTVLGGRSGLAAVKPLPAFGRLDLLVAGDCPPNPLDLLSRDAFPALLQGLRPDFDVILFDTPAAEFCADAQSVARHAGNALVVARQHRTRLASTTELVGHLQDEGTRVLGTLLNAP